MDAPDRKVYVLLDVASKGSVQDVLCSTINLTLDLKVSLIRDIAYGIKYLHSSDIGKYLF